MKTIDLAIHADWVITVDADNRVLESQSILVDKGQILDIVPTDSVNKSYSARDESSLPGHALIPGLINSHTHAAMTLLRGYADDLPLMEWLQNHIWPAEGRWVDQQFVTDGTQLAIAEMIKGGTTCFNDMYFFPDAAARTASQAGMRAVVGLIVLDFPTVWASDANEYIAKGTALHDEVRNMPLITTAFAPHAPYTVSAAPLQKIAALSHELEIPVHIHLHETIGEVEQFIAQHGVRPFQRLDELGLVSPSLLAVHMTQLEEDEIARVAEAGTHILHCPEANMKLANGFCPIKSLLEAGCNIALGTDGAASNNDLDMFGEMRSAALIAKGSSRDASVFNANEVLRATTINAARALNLEAQIGSLEAGKSADIVAVNFDRCALQPVYDPVSHLVYAAGRDDVSNVWVAGKQLLEDARLTTIDESAVIAEAKQWRDKIASA
ncbi:MAG: TRZ/ATZ family hydrolase [Pseudomonadota bacterium]